MGTVAAFSLVTLGERKEIGSIPFLSFRITQGSQGRAGMYCFALRRENAKQTHETILR